ncbi:MAG: hypothetical protein JO110_17690 [Acetobacteraceae bacterium]|nr:hypothetical protein [Acetobacteraceae bacterium]
MASIVPDLAIGWSWNEDGTELTMPLRQGVRWHDGKPFTAKDVQCTWDLLASGWSPVYPCHVSPRDLRAHPIGTGPFKFVEFRPNERIRVARNPEYWKPGRPYLDGIEWPIVPSLATRILGFVAGSFDQVFGVTIPPLQGLKRQVPQAVCDVFPANLPRTLLVNRTAPPFDNPELQRAMALSLDHQA